MSSAIDYKKLFPDLYLPKAAPATIEVPQMSFIAIDGRGDPNPANSSFAKAMRVLYAISYTIKMSKMSGSQPEGYFDYVVPPLEGLWWTSDGSPVVPEAKSKFCWRMMIRLPEFVDRPIFEWAVELASQKKGIDCSGADFVTVQERLCVQAMHHGSYDSEGATIEAIYRYMAAEGLKADFWEKRLHHEIYLSDPRRTAPERNRTVLRVPVRHVIPELQTERLFLRECLVSDADDIFAYSADPEVGPNAGWEPHKTVADSVEVIRTIFAWGYVWAMVDKPSGHVIGSLGLHSNRLGNGCWELGYAMGRDYWGRGLMTEAAREVLRYGFEVLGLKEIECGCFPFNHRSQRVIEKLGFEPCGIIPKSFVRFDGEALDELRFTLRKAQFDSQK